MTQNFAPAEWPSTGRDLNERRAIFVYEGARLQAAAMNAPVIPEPWWEREEAFREQFLPVIEQQMGPGRSDSPEMLHEQWRESYENMGWQYGEVRDPEKKTHPDMVPFDQLGFAEQIKDEVFVRLCEIARTCIVDL
jgi:RyR domain